MLKVDYRLLVQNPRDHFRLITQYSPEMEWSRRLEFSVRMSGTVLGEFQRKKEFVAPFDGGLC